jgi:glycosyltransferase involved in cell wall biosynthesis
MPVGAPDAVRVLHVAEAAAGGVAKWIELALTGLDPTRVEQACACSFARTPPHQPLRGILAAGDVPCWTVPMTRAISPSRDAWAICRVAHIIRRWTPDVVHGHSAKGGMVARLAVRLARSHAKTVYSPHAFPFQAPGPMRRIYWGLERLAVPLTDALLAVSEAEAAEARTLGHRPEPLTVIPNALPPRGVPGPRLSDRPFVIGFLGGLRLQKAPHVFVEAARRLHQRRGSLRFVVCGDGALADETAMRARRAGLAECCVFLGHVDDVADHLQQWRVAVFPSRYEGCPYGLLEAMQAGTPVVASAVSGHREIVRHGHNGLLTPPRSPQAIADAVELLLTHPGKADRLARAARKTVEQRHGLAEQIKKLTAFYERIAHEKRCMEPAPSRDRHALDCSGALGDLRRRGRAPGPARRPAEPVAGGSLGGGVG